jgi:hypothetical protein
MRERYVVADRATKHQLLDEAVAVTGHHRKSLIRAWRVGPPRRGRVRRRGRPPRYGPAVARALRAIWAAAGYPWSLRLKALLPLWVPWARRRLSLASATEAALRQISARQIDRVLRPHRHRLQRRQYGRTKPGTLLKHHIALKTDRWEVQDPGYTEIDLVAHAGDRADGEFAHSLNLTDIQTTWVETGALLGKSQARVRAMLEQLRAQLPFPLRGIDSDNGSEFINAHLYGYCRAEQIQFTRGRPYKKDDNAHIEQKNWTHVRKLLGYVRYDTEAAVDAMNAVYADLRLLQNLFLPSVKLLRKDRVGARVRRRYDAPRTPLQRLQASGGADPAKLQALDALARTLNPFELARRVDEGLARVYRLATLPRGRTPLQSLRGAARQSATPRPPTSPLTSRPSPVTVVLARRCAAG